ncbi:MAG: YidC/Oxa1 family insertase periplasmic-domain containing protein [Planctomycetota bacterium]|nr:YidC/Oxa1 family insertase periplasmic-domain containing protein [Planctomycetota bacterium]
MPRPPNRFLRFLVPFILVGVGVGIAFAFFLNTTNAQKRSSPQPAPQQAQTTPTAPATPVTTPGASPDAQVPPPVAGAPAQPSPAPIPVPAGTAPTTLGTLRVRPGTPGDIGAIGSIDPTTNYLLHVRFSSTGAGIAEVRLAEHLVSIRDDTRVVAQSEHVFTWNGVTQVLTPMAATEIEIGRPGERPQALALATTPSGPAWSPIAGTPGAAELVIVNEQDQPVVRVTRHYTVGLGTYQVHLLQRVENLSGAPLVVRLFQIGPVDLEQDPATYGGDKRRVRFGYLLPASVDPARQTVVADSALTSHPGALGERDAAGVFAEKSVWPSEDIARVGSELSWAGMTNRYFAAAVLPIVDPAAQAPDKRLTWVGGVARTVLDRGGGQEVMALRLDGAPVMVPPGGAASMDLALFAGPLDRSEINQEPALKSVGLAGIVVYNFGEMCGFCTFGPITSLLLGLLHVLHDYLFQDWSLAIIFLVVIVRTCLHPVTRWSQIRMAVFGKQMQGMAPKQKELQEKFKGDPKRLQEETARLWREEGISPAGFLGCLPAFLQTPVWIALYATLYFAVELRHHPAFYGLFQVQPQSSPFWQFLGDLSVSDRFVYFGKVLFEIPLLGPIDSINLLPIVLGIVFFIQQKYIQPPSAATLTPEQQLQQKMMKWMMVVMFPLFMYNAPSGLALYFVTNSALAILESKWIRAHMEKHGMLDLDKIRAARNAARAQGVGTSMIDRKHPGAQSAGARKPEGFFARLQRQLEERQKEAQKQAMRDAKRPPGRKKA